MAHQPNTDRTTTPTKGECSYIDVNMRLQLIDLTENPILTINPIDIDGDFILEIENSYSYMSIPITKENAILLAEYITNSINKIK